jgi:hypothetical protein
MGMLQGLIRNTQWRAVLFQPALYHRKWTIGTGEVHVEAPAEVDLKSLGIGPAHACGPQLRRPFIMKIGKDLTHRGLWM